MITLSSMRRVAGTALFLAALLTLACQSDRVAGGSTSTETEISLAGRVVDKDNAPVAGIEVKLAEAGFTDTTDALGIYRVEGVRKGIFSDTLLFSRTGQRLAAVRVTRRVETLPDVRIVQRDISGGLLASPARVARIEAVLTGDDISPAQPLVTELFYSAPANHYSGFVYFPTATGTRQYSVLVNAYDSLGRFTGRSRTIAFSSLAGDILVPDFNPLNAVPKAYAGEDTILYVSESLLLHGAAVDSFGVAIPKWEWDVGGTGLFKASALPDTAVLLPADSMGKYLCILRVTDDDGNISSPDTLSVKILPSKPQPPSFSALVPVTNERKPAWSWNAGVGGNGTYRFKLDDTTLSTGAVVTTSTNFTPVLDLADGPHFVCVQNHDILRSWSASACATTIVDFTPPNAPIASGATPTNGPKPTWTWTAGGGGNGTYRYRLDNPDLSTGATSTTSLAFTPTTDLAAGSHTLCVQERDTVGNWSASGCATVVIDLTSPNAPIASGPTPTNSPKPTWTWTTGGGGNGTYRYRLDDPDLSTGATSTTSLTFTPTEDLAAGSHTLCVQERDTVGNWSASGCATVVIDLTPPGAPIASGPTPTNNPKPTWTWTAGGGGNGTYRYRLDDPDLSTGATVTTSLAFTPTTDLGAGSHTLCVQERDAAGNWSVSGCASLVIGLTPPGAPIISGPPLTNNPKPTWTWTAGGGGNGTYRYRVDNPDLSTDATVTTSLTFTPTADLGAGSHTLCVQERDAAGNWSASGCATAVIDLTPPARPVVKRDPAIPMRTSNRRPTWTWIGGGGGQGVYRIKMDESNLATGATQTSNASFTPDSDLAYGSHTLYVQERDSAGNWSSYGSSSAIITNPAAQTFVAAGEGVINITTDGGETWQPQVISETVRQMLFVNSTTGWAITSGGSLRKTTNAGATWIDQSVNSEVVSSISFVDVNTGWAVGLNGLFKTTNSGQTWTGPTRDYPASILPGSVQFVNANVGWVSGGQTGGTWKTLDGGETWTKQQAGSIGGRYISEDTGWANVDGGFAKTTDGGVTWTTTLVTTQLGQDNYSPFFFVDDNTGWGAGQYGSIIRTTNAGLTWTLDYGGTPVIDGFHALYFNNAGKGFVAGDKGRIMRSTGGANAWTPLNTSTKARLWYIGPIP